jgi:hypothetical protein
MPWRLFTQKILLIDFMKLLCEVAAEILFAKAKKIHR